MRIYFYSDRQIKLCVWALALLLLTPLRSAAVIISPLILLVVYSIHPFRVFHEVRWLMLIWLFTSFVGVVCETTSWKNVVVSAIVFLPMLPLLFMRPIHRDKSFLVTHSDYIKKAFIALLIIINILGFLYWLQYGMDAMEFAYGKHYEGVHGLAMIDILVALYLGIKLSSGRRTWKTIGLFLFFCVAIICCQYGLGMVCLFVSLILYMLLERKIKYAVSAIITLFFVSWALSTDMFSYERENIKKAETGDDARKVMMFDDFFHNITNDINICLVGTGAGGYNSRSALILSPDYNNPMKDVLGSSTPPYFKKYIQNLWNGNLVDFDKHTDGTRNKPYSSMVSLWAEHGIFFFFTFIILLRNNYVYLRQYKRQGVLYKYVFLSDIFMIVSNVSHLWIESSEFIVYCLIRYLCLVQMNRNKEAPS